MNGTWEKDTVIGVRMDERGRQGSGEVDGVWGWGAIAARSSRTASSAASRWACESGRGGGFYQGSGDVHWDTHHNICATKSVRVRSKARRRGKGVKG